MKKQLFFVSTLCVLAVGSLLVSCSKKEDVSQLPSSCLCTFEGYSETDYFTRKDMKEILDEYGMEASSCSQFAKALEKIELYYSGEHISVTCENGD
ncbi:MAG: hypothetical protein MJ007_06200 [Paludibacteraceae bacterium]|nr:hypothetical protein [Paludibacteraceae bacterium]